MTAWTNYYAESTGDVSTTSASDQAKVTLNFTPNASKDHLVIWSALVEGTTAADVRVNCKDTAGTVQGQGNVEAKDASDYCPVFGIWKFTSGGSPGAESFTLNYSAEAGVTVHIKEARILVLEMDATDQFAENTSDQTNTTTTDSNAVTLSFTPGTAGDYLVIGSLEYRVQTASTEIIWKLNDGATNYGTTTYRPEDTTNYVPQGHFFKKNLSGAQTLTLKWARSATGAVTVNARNARLAAIRLDKFANNYAAQVRATRTTTTATSFTNKVTATATPVATDHLILGTVVRDQNSTTISGRTKILDGAGDIIAEAIQEGVVASTTIDFACYMQMRRRTEAASSTSWSVGFATETSGTSTGADEAAIIVVELTASAAGFSVTVPLGALTAAGQAPTVTATANVSISVPAGALTAAGAAPGVIRGTVAAVPAGALTATAQTPAAIKGTVVAVPAGGLTSSGQTPAVTATAHVSVGVPAGALTATGAAPSAILGTVIGVPAGALTASGQAPVPGLSMVISIPLGTLTAAGLSPAVTATAHVSLGVPAGALTATGAAPAADIDVLVAVPAGQLAVNGLVPAADIDVVVAVPAGGLTAAGFAPTVQAGGDVAVTVPAGALTFGGLAPAADIDVVAAVPAGALTATGQAPVPAVAVTIAVPLGMLSLTGFAPAADIDAVVNVPQGGLTATGLAPVSQIEVDVPVPAGQLGITGFVPAAIATANLAVSIDAGVLVLGGFVPAVSIEVPFVEPPIVYEGEPSHAARARAAGPGAEGRVDEGGARSRAPAGAAAARDGQDGSRARAPGRPAEPR